MQNQVIEVLNKKHGKKVIKYFQSLDFNTKDWWGTASRETNCLSRFYGVINGEFGNYKLSDLPDDTHIITLPPEYPKVMRVWNEYENSKFTRVVFMEKNNKYMAWELAETLEEANNAIVAYAWGRAEDIKQEEVKELTLQEIADKFNIYVENLRIKD